MVAKTALKISKTPVMPLLPMAWIARMPRALSERAQDPIHRILLVRIVHTVYYRSMLRKPRQMTPKPSRMRRTRLEAGALASIGRVREKQKGHAMRVCPF